MISFNYYGSFENIQVKPKAFPGSVGEGFSCLPKQQILNLLFFAARRQNHKNPDKR
jgi:hypothetical protein